MHALAVTLTVMALFLGVGLIVTMVMQNRTNIFAALSGHGVPGEVGLLPLGGERVIAANDDCLGATGLVA